MFNGNEFAPLAVYQKIFKRRVLIAKLIIFAVFFGIITRLIFLQVINYDFYQRLAYTNRVNTYPIAPSRGIIYSRNKNIIADNISAYQLEIIPEHSRNLNKTILEISKIIPLSPEEIALFFNNVMRKRRFDKIPLKLNLSAAELNLFANQSYQFPEAEIAARLKRSYPLGLSFAHIVGYLGRINDKEITKLNNDPNYAATNMIGKIGIEHYYETLLHGKAGQQAIEVDAFGRALRDLKHTPAINGANLQLTIDDRLQKFAIQLLEDKSGAIVAISPKNGEILTMVSNPSYDPNDFINGLNAQQYQLLENSTAKPLFNRAVRGQYPPASTIKPIVALKALESEVIDEDYEVYDRGYFKLENDPHLYRDWKQWGHGWTSLKKALIESCDTFFYDLSFKLNIQHLYDVFHEFSLGELTGIDLDEELPGLVPDPNWKKQVKNQPWFVGETLITGIGQGFLLSTPLQMAVMTSILANHGTYYKPHLVKAIQHDDGKWDLVEPVIKAQIQYSDHNWNLINSALIDVVNHYKGTAHRIANNLNYKIAAKTGTAQVFSVKQGKKYVSAEVDEKLRDHSLFIGYAPADDPKIALAIIIENGADSDLHSSTLGRKLMDKYFALNKNVS